MMRPGQLDPDRAGLLIIDVQVKLLPLIPRAQPLLKAIGKLLRGSRVFELPVLATEQYVRGLGPTEDAVRRALDAAHATVIEKPTFSGWGHEPVRDALRDIDRPQIILAGIETHVCVRQTALDLLSRDFEVFVCVDAVAARFDLDHDVALRAMRHAGVTVTTVESALFELCQRCDTPRFKAMLEVIKE